MDPNKISHFIYQLRKEQKLSQYQLADLIPISRQAVSKWERGQTIPDSSTLIRLSEIFDVTINELLKGERLSNNTIKDLEITTLKIVDDNNKKTKIIRRSMLYFIIVCLIFTITFLSYYFINSYNKIKVYRISGKSMQYDIVEGIFITTKQKNYLKLGRIIPLENNEISSIKAYYLKDNKPFIVLEDTDIDNIIIDIYGYQEILPTNHLKEIISNFYIEITNKEGIKDTIHLSFLRDFTNKLYLFSNKGQEQEIIKDTSNNLEIIDNIINKSVSENDYYIIRKDNSELYYYPSFGQLVLYQEKEIIWTWFLNEDIYTCQKIIEEEVKKELDNDNCKNRIYNDINLYIGRT